MLRAVTFVTIGQTPRTDLVPELASWLPDDLEVHELGALDGMGEEAVAALAPEEGEARLVTRMADGRQVVVAKWWMDARLQQMLDGLRPGADHATVLLCTGSFPRLRPSGLFLDAQHLVDHGVAALSAGMRRIGLVLPLAEQAGQVHLRPAAHQEVVTTHASPYEGDRFDEAGRALAHCDAVVMHCMGYTEEQRRRVAAAAGRPVLLARRFVAAALVQLL